MNARILYLILKVISISVSLVGTVSSASPLKGLYLTSPGYYHEYQYQAEIMKKLMAEQVGLRLDVSLGELGRWKTTDFSQDYDLLIFNICTGKNTDTSLISNMRRQIEELKVPSVVIHCAIHSFRDTNDWWPVVGLRSYEHEKISSIAVNKVAFHPITAPLPDDWLLEEDELYLNLAFEGQALLSSMGNDGQEHVIAWLKETKGADLFGITLGHTKTTFDDPQFQQLLVRASRHLLGVSLSIEEVVDPIAGSDFSAPSGVDYLTSDDRSCIFRATMKGAGFCYLGCVLNPLHWGEETQNCKRVCIGKLPERSVLAADCRSARQSSEE